VVKGSVISSIRNSSFFIRTLKQFILHERQIIPVIEAGSVEFSEESVKIDLRGSEGLLLCAEMEHLLDFFCA